MEFIVVNFLVITFYPKQLPNLTFNSLWIIQYYFKNNQLSRNKDLILIALL